MVTVAVAPPGEKASENVSSGSAVESATVSNGMSTTLTPGSSCVDPGATTASFPGRLASRIAVTPAPVQARETGTALGFSTVIETCRGARPPPLPSTTDADLRDDPRCDRCALRFRDGARAGNTIGGVRIVTATEHRGLNGEGSRDRGTISTDASAVSLTPRSPIVQIQSAPSWRARVSREGRVDRSRAGTPTAPARHSQRQDRRFGRWRCRRRSPPTGTVTGPSMLIERSELAGAPPGR